uniref:Pigment dispersing factor n=1 Tax=Lygus hesperus TaxID=30085 RepID=A0A7U0Q6Y9_LYGHE|nr:pigment dispersing factor precursor [Lygus hesperus]
MVYRMLFAAVFGFCICVHAMQASSFTLSEEAVQELQSMDPAATRELAYILLEAAKGAQKTQKRNSEIINSLLGLPKVLNDAGR